METGKETSGSHVCGIDKPFVSNYLYGTKRSNTPLLVREEFIFFTKRNKNHFVYKHIIKFFVFTKYN
jgi:hypothetical protein